MLNNKLNDKYQYFINEKTSYQNNEESVANNVRFTGSKITSSGWNKPSNDSNPKPVVEFNVVDPLSLTIDLGKDSNLKVN